MQLCGQALSLVNAVVAFPCHIHLPESLWIVDTHRRAPKKNASYGNEVLPQDTTHLIQRPCYQRESPCQDPQAIGPHEDLLTSVKRHKLQWYGHVSCSSGLAKTISQGSLKWGRRQGRQRKRWEKKKKRGMDRPGVRQVPEGSKE